MDSTIRCLRKYGNKMGWPGLILADRPGRVSGVVDRELDPVAEGKSRLCASGQHWPAGNGENKMSIERTDSMRSI